ncbi:hypothetical protein [Glutamicibacter sp. X7]
MAAVDLGSIHTIEWKTRPEASTISAEVTRPDGQLVTPVIDQPDGTATVTADLPGRWRIRWEAGTGEVDTDIFDVWPDDPRYLISLDDAQASLGAARASASYLQDLRLYIAAATPVIEDITGPILLATTQITTAGGGNLIMLDWSATVTQVTVDGNPVERWYTEHGILYAGSRQDPDTFPAGTLTVTVQTGYAAIPPNIRLAARELVRHWVQIGKQSSGGSSVRQDPTDEVFTPSGFAVPRRVVELCEPNKQIGGFA